MNFNYSVPQKWYENVYRDKKQPCSAARSFSLLHPEKTQECWLLLHGYRGYPGELVRPAQDLFESGFDVFVPRIPGHGTSRKDFIASRGKDWLTFCDNALSDLCGKYGTVNILGHSMGSSVAAVIGAGREKVGKIIYVSPSFENAQMPLPARIILKALSPFTPHVPCKWHPSSKYHQHYENAPCDELYLGDQYWRFYFTKQLGDYYKIMKRALQCVKRQPHKHLVIVPQLDKIISAPSVKLYQNAVAYEQNVVYIPNATHNVFYDKDPAAEEAAVQAVLKFALEKE